ncbi:MAG: acyl-CoA thioesterase [Desulfobacteraceae bacterium]|nr:acyl-CoA thioesterase [Desulfobacteraceae bacterium]
MEIKIKIRGYHTDSYQHVNNARYLEFLEEARWQIVEEFMEITDFIQNELSFFVVNINISYRSPAKVNDVILIKTGLHKISSKSAVFRQEIINTATGKICIQADITFVVADKTGKAIALKGEIKEALNKIPGV